MAAYAQNYTLEIEGYKVWKLILNNTIATRIIQITEKRTCCQARRQEIHELKVRFCQYQLPNNNQTTEKAIMNAIWSLDE